MVGHWHRSKQPEKNRALNFAIGDAVNLEGAIAMSDHPDISIQNFVSSRFIEVPGPYDSAMPSTGQVVTSGSRRVSFALGAALSLTVGEQVETLQVTDAQAKQALDEMQASLKQLDS